MSKPRTFQELATKAHDIELTIANRRRTSFSVVESKNDGAKLNKNIKFSTSSTKETMTTSKAELVWIMRGPNPEEKRSVPFKDMIRRCLTLK